MVASSDISPIVVAILDQPAYRFQSLRADVQKAGSINIRHVLLAWYERVRTMIRTDQGTLARKSSERTCHPTERRNRGSAQTSVSDFDLYSRRKGLVSPGHRRYQKVYTGVHLRTLFPTISTMIFAQKTSPQIFTSSLR